MLPNPNLFPTGCTNDAEPPVDAAYESTYAAPADDPGDAATHAESAVGTADDGGRRRWHGRQVNLHPRTRLVLYLLVNQAVGSDLGENMLGAVY